jgi:hypothetical protein
MLNVIAHYKIRYRIYESKDLAINNGMGYVKHKKNRFTIDFTCKLICFEIAVTMLELQFFAKSN